jgi:hypothetical protein
VRKKAGDFCSWKEKILKGAGMEEGIIRDSGGVEKPSYRGNILQ